MKQYFTTANFRGKADSLFLYPPFITTGSATSTAAVLSGQGDAGNVMPAFRYNAAQNSVEAVSIGETPGAETITTVIDQNRSK